jgi:hypothetical protein
MRRWAPYGWLAQAAVCLSSHTNPPRLNQLLLPYRVRKDPKSGLYESPMTWLTLLRICAVQTAATKYSVASCLPATALLVAALEDSYL